MLIGENLRRFVATDGTVTIRAGLHNDMLRFFEVDGRIVKYRPTLYDQGVRIHAPLPGVYRITRVDGVPPGIVDYWGVRIGDPPPLAKNCGA